MAHIGTLTAQGNRFAGAVRTLTLDVKVTFIPNTKRNVNAPDYRIHADGGNIIGAAWKKISKTERPYLAVKLDDPSFPTPVYARLVEGRDRSHLLYWSRS